MSAVLKSPLPRLRAMRETDLEEVLAVETRAYAHPWTEGIFRDCLRVGYHCWVCEEPGAIIGYGVMSVAAGESHVLNLCVRPDRQRLGLGRKLLLRLLTEARRKNADTAFLEVRDSNRAAIALYLGEGFNEIGLRKGYYPAGEGREDALVLAKSLA